MDIIKLMLGLDVPNYLADTPLTKALKCTPHCTYVRYSTNIGFLLLTFNVK